LLVAGSVVLVTGGVVLVAGDGVVAELVADDVVAEVGGLAGGRSAACR
jgi:hypothetical protein